MSFIISERKRSPFSESRSFAEIGKSTKKERSVLDCFVDSRTEGFP